jgi:hypothetical protein
VEIYDRLAGWISRSHHCAAGQTYAAQAGDVHTGTSLEYIIMDFIAFISLADCHERRMKKSLFEASELTAGCDTMEEEHFQDSKDSYRNKTEINKA